MEAVPMPEAFNADCVGAFLWMYREKAREILNAMENDHWPNAWRLVKERERLCRLNAQAPQVQHFQNKLSGNHPRLHERAFLRDLYQEVQDIDGRCIQLVEKQIGTIRTELNDLNVQKRFNVSQSVQVVRHPRFVDTEG
jgi:ABC-type phosphate transport system auxiliary subunit